MDAILDMLMPRNGIVTIENAPKINVGDPLLSPCAPVGSPPGIPLGNPSGIPLGSPPLVSPVSPAGSPEVGGADVVVDGVPVVLTIFVNGPLACVFRFASECGSSTSCSSSLRVVKGDPIWDGLVFAYPSVS